jgi:hypothetical protein
MDNWLFLVCTVGFAGFVFVIVGVLSYLRAGQYPETNSIAKFRPDFSRREIGQRERDVELEKWREEHKPSRYWRNLSPTR